jgi:MFS family permease
VRLFGSQLATMAVGSCKVVALVVATMFFDRVGRKPMLLLSAAGLFVAYCIEGARCVHREKQGEGWW